MDFYKFELIKRTSDKIFNIYVEIIENNNKYYNELFKDEPEFLNDMNDPEYLYNKFSNKELIKDGEYTIRNKIYNYLLNKYDNDINFFHNLLKFY